MREKFETDIPRIFFPDTSPRRSRYSLGRGRNGAAIAVVINIAIAHLLQDSPTGGIEIGGWRNARPISLGR